MSTKDEAALSGIEEKEFTALFNEYHMLRSEMKLYLGFLRRDTSIILVVAGAFIAFLKLGGSINDLLPLTPTVVFIYLLAQLMSLHMISAEAKACAKIELKINKLFGDRAVLEWESITAKKDVRGYFTVTTLSTIGIALVSVMFFFYFSYLASKQVGGFINYIHAVEAIILGVLFVALWRYEYHDRKGKHNKANSADAKSRTAD